MENILVMIDADGNRKAVLGVADYDGRTVVKRNGEKKVMEFKSGKHGFYAGGKVQIDGKDYQVSCCFTEISRKPSLNGAVHSFSREQIAEMNEQARQTEEQEGE